MYLFIFGCSVRHWARHWAITGSRPRWGPCPLGREADSCEPAVLQTDGNNHRALGSEQRCGSRGQGVTLGRQGTSLRKWELGGKELTPWEPGRAGHQEKNQGAESGSGSRKWYQSWWYPLMWTHRCRRRVRWAGPGHRGPCGPKASPDIVLRSGWGHWQVWGWGSVSGSDMGLGCLIKDWEPGR